MMRRWILCGVAALVLVAPAAQAQQGDTCAIAGFITDGLSGGPAVLSGTTIGTTNDYVYGSNCGGYNGSSGLGRDVVYKLETATDCTVTVNLVSTQLPVAYDTALWVVTDCSDPVGGCIGGDDAYGQPEEVVFSAVTGTTYYIIVDAYGTTSDGPYDLTITGAGCGTLVPVTLSSFSIE